MHYTVSVTMQYTLLQRIMVQYTVTSRILMTQKPFLQTPSYDDATEEEEEFLKLQASQKSDHWCQSWQ